jgi:NADH-quinone oxidoreductase subunit N
MDGGFPMNVTDYLSLSPLLILLAGGLLTLLLETFADAKALFWSSILGLATFALTGLALLTAPSIGNPLLTPWIVSDALAQSGSLLILAVAIGVNLISGPLFRKHPTSRSEFDFFLIMASAGVMLIASSADFLTLFLGLEILSLSLYILTGYMRGWSLSGEASLKYFLMGAIGAAFLVYGIALIYGATGTTGFKGLLAAFRSIQDGQEFSLFWGGIAFITVGLSFKAAIVPFHFWAPDVYEGAPTPVTAFMSVGVKLGAFLAFARIFLVALPQFSTHWEEAIAVFAIISLIYANFVALQQTNLRRFFAYSGISHSGFLLIPFAAQGAYSLTALLFYLTVYALATLIAFAVLAEMDEGEGGVRLEDLKGLAYRSPFLTGLFTLSLLTLAGIPPTAGFFAKFYLFKGALEAGHLTLVIIALLTTVLAFAYYLRFIAILFAQERAKHETSILSNRIVIFTTAATLALIGLSLFPEPLLALLK